MAPSQGGVHASRTDHGTTSRHRASVTGTLARFRRDILARFQRDSSGDVAIMFALMAVAMCLFVGAGVDIGRWLHARQQTIAAMDAAVLAGGRELQLDSTNVAGAIEAAKKFYAENTKTRVPVLSDTIAFTTANNNTTFTASGNAFIATPLLAFASISKLPLLNSSGTEFSKAQAKPSGNGEGNLEIALMLDVTGSMAGSKIKDMKDAATDLVDIAVAADQSQYTSRLALIPFSEGVRLPSDSNAAARGSPPSSVSLTCSGGWWGGTTTCTYDRTKCVVERAGNDKYTDAAPAAGNYVMTMYTSDGKCALTSSGELVPLTSDKTLLKNKIKNLTDGGGTAGQIGTAWAWYTLSPNWNTLWPAANQAAAYSTKLRKTAILMTDGEYNTDYDSHGVKTGTNGAGPAANEGSTNQARALCTAMKAKGITVYTVGFDLGGNQTAIDTLNQCATDPSKFYNAANGEQLKEAFRDIALQLNKLYLTQ
jgi:Flp pilus assembly protein TadG